VDLHRRNSPGRSGSIYLTAKEISQYAGSGSSKPSLKGDGGMDIRHSRCLKIDRVGQAMSDESLLDIAGLPPECFELAERPRSSAQRTPQ
jgi:hypothetical protein